MITALIIILVLIFLSAIIYWFNLDMKLIYKITPYMMRHYDNMKRDRRL